MDAGHDLIPPEGKQHSRRSFFRRTWSWLAALAGAELLLAGLSFVGGGRKKGTEGEETVFTALASLDDIPPGGAFVLPAVRVSITRPDRDTVVALSLRCTHLGCSIEWDEKEKSFHCPCHHSRFDIHGEVLNPPATRPLDQYPLKIVDGEILVDLEHPRSRRHVDPDLETHV